MTKGGGELLGEGVGLALVERSRGVSRPSFLLTVPTEDAPELVIPISWGEALGVSVVEQLAGGVGYLGLPGPRIRAVIWPSLGCEVSVGRIDKVCKVSC